MEHIHINVERGQPMLTSEILAPITTAVESNLTLLIPVGVGIMALLFGVRLVPKVIKILAK